MVFSRRSGIAVLFVIFLHAGSAQVLNIAVRKTLRVTSDTVLVDSLSIVPGSMSYTMFPSNNGKEPVMNHALHALVFQGERPDSLVVSYKHFPLNFEKRY